MSDEHYYKVGGSLEYQHPTYVVRQADCDLYEGLKNGEFCYVLNSRQMGKSSLRVQMMKKLKEQGIKCASIDMTRIGSHVTPSEWYAGVISELLRGFGLSRKVNFSNWWRDRDSLPPLQRLRELIEDVLLEEFPEKLVIFIDEIDSIIKIKFKEDFFAFIRACYNQRVDNPDYNRLTFCLLGVATPSDLIEDRNVSTPFNIGRAIELTGFQLHEAAPLAQGLSQKTPYPQAVLQEVLAWTGGQPFLTQKVCKLILSTSEEIPPGDEARWVEQLVRSRIIENWETQDEPEHLRTVRDRIIWSDRKEQLLQLYQQILQTSLAPPDEGGDGGVKANDKPEHMELRLSGLVVKRQGKLRVYNRIYASVFDQTWVENALAEAGLLPKVAEKLPPSRAEIQALEQAALDALQQFESQQVEALILAMQVGQELKVLVEDGRSLQDYPTVLPVYALHVILSNIREQNRLNGHLGWVNSVSFSPDGQCIATAGKDGTARLWNLSGQQMAQLNGHRGWVNSVSFSPDGQCIATAGKDGTARLWNLSGQQMAQLNGHLSWINSVSFSPDGQCIATAGKDGTARLWNLSGQQMAQLNGHLDAVYSVSFSPNGQRIATAGADGTLRLWDWFGNQLAQLNSHQGGVRNVSFSPDGECIATAGKDGMARLWNLSGQQMAQLNGHLGAVYSVSFSPDGQRIATAGADGTLRLWDWFGNQLAQLKSHQGVVRNVGFSPDGQCIATAGKDGTIRLWDLSEKPLAQWNSHHDRVWSVSFSSDGQHLATVGADSSIRLWNLRGKQLAQFNGHQGWVRRVSFSPDGQRLATLGYDGTIRLWNLEGQQIVLNGHQGRVNSVSFSPDGQQLATAEYDGTIRFWNLEGKQLNQLNTNHGKVYDVSFSPDGQHLATAGADGIIRFWNLLGQQLLEFKVHRGWVYSLSFSPNGQCLTTGGTGGTVRLWNLSGHELVQWQSHQGTVYCISFHPNGQQIATAGADGMAKLWDLSGRQLAQWQSPNNSVYSVVSFNPDGQCLAAAGTGGLQIWRIGGLDELLVRGCDWLKDYVITHPEALEKLAVCQNRLNSIEVDRNLAGVGEVEGALGKPIPKENALLQKVPELRPTLDSAPKTQLRQLAAKTLVALFGEILSRQGDIEKAVAAYTEAQKLDPTLEIPATVGNNLCWWGSLWGNAAEVMDACETAVALDPENAMFRDSRGLARALTGNIAGAIEDFQAFVDWTDNEKKKLQRQHWIEVLRAGENPFTEEEIESLFNEHNVTPPEALEELEVRQLVTTVSDESEEGFLGEFLVRDKLVKIYQGDITNLVTDVIVSSDDNYLTMGGGVSARIRQVGGEKIYRQTENLIPLSLGEVAVTTAGKLRARKLFHAVVIDFYEGEKLSDKVIQRVVHSCMKKASLYDFRSIAFPLLGTGAAGFPAKVVWEIMFRQIIRDLSAENQTISEVIVAIYQKRIIEELKIKIFLEAIEEFGWKSLL